MSSDYKKNMAEPLGLDERILQAPEMPGIFEVPSMLCPRTTQFSGQWVVCTSGPGFESPDTQYSVTRRARCLVEPLMQDWIALKRSVRYLLGTKSFVMRCEEDYQKDFFETEVDADGARCVRTRRSTSGGEAWFLGCLICS